MSDVDNLQNAEEFVAQREEQERREQLEAADAELAAAPLKSTALRPRRRADLRLSQIHGGDNMRLDLSEIDELAMSIRQKGLLLPLAVRPWGLDDDGPEPEGEGPFFRIVAGHRRHAALHRLAQQALRAHASEEDTLDPLVRSEVLEELSAAEVYELMLTENVQRVPLEPMAAARALRFLLDLNAGTTAADLARSLGLRPAWVQEHFRLLDLPPETQELVEAGDLSFTVAMMLRRGQTMGRIDADEANALAKKVAKGEMAPKDLRDVVAPKGPMTAAPKTVLVDEDGNPIEDAAAAGVKKTPPSRAGASDAEALPWDEPEAPRMAAGVDEDARYSGAEGLLRQAPDAPRPGPGQIPLSHEAVQRASDVEPNDDEFGSVGAAIDLELDRFLLMHVLRDLAPDEHLNDIGINRGEEEDYASAQDATTCRNAFRHAALALRNTVEN